MINIDNNNNSILFEQFAINNVVFEIVTIYILVNIDFATNICTYVDINLNIHYIINTTTTYVSSLLEMLNRVVKTWNINKINQLYCKVNSFFETQIRLQFRFFFLSISHFDMLIVVFFNYSRSFNDLIIVDKIFFIAFFVNRFFVAITMFLRYYSNCRKLNVNECSNLTSLFF